MEAANHHQILTVVVRDGRGEGMEATFPQKGCMKQAAGKAMDCPNPGHGRHQKSVELKCLKVEIKQTGLV